jgi:hypothetical protein
MTKPTSFLQAALREPLLHFVLLGGLVFGAEYLIRSKQDDPSLIVVGPEVEQEARAIFRSAKGREPSPAELQILRERWVDNEVLYREGLALRLEQGDQTLRERVIFKALNVIESNLRLPEADEVALRIWFESHRDAYDSPALYDFSEALPSDTDPATALAFAAALNSGAQADVQSGLRIFQARPRNTIVPAFGSEFTDALDTLPLREWHVLPSSDGARIVRLERRVAGVRATFEEARPRVLQDWRDAKAQDLRSSAVRELAKKYRVQISESSS